MADAAHPGRAGGACSRSGDVQPGRQARRHRRDGRQRSADLGRWNRQAPAFAPGADEPELRVIQPGRQGSRQLRCGRCRAHLGRRPRKPDPGAPRTRRRRVRGPLQPRRQADRDDRRRRYGEDLGHRDRSAARRRQWCGRLSGGFCRQGLPRRGCRLDRAGADGRPNRGRGGPGDVPSSRPSARVAVSRRLSASAASAASSAASSAGRFPSSSRSPNARSRVR